MKTLGIAALTLLSALSAAAAAAPAAPATGAAHGLIDTYENFCLQRFGGAARLAEDAAAANAHPASDAEAAEALHGHVGRAFTVDLPDGHFVVAAWDAPARGCVVSGAGAETPAQHALWDITVTVYAGQRELGTLERLHPQAGPGTSMSVLVAHERPAPDEAFIAISAQPAGEPARTRYVRQVAAGGAHKP